MVHEYLEYGEKKGVEVSPEGTVAAIPELCGLRLLLDLYNR